MELFFNRIVDYFKRRRKLNQEELQLFYNVIDNNLFPRNRSEIYPEIWLNIFYEKWLYRLFFDRYVYFGYQYCTKWRLIDDIAVGVLISRLEAEGLILITGNEFNQVKSTEACYKCKFRQPGNARAHLLINASYCIEKDALIFNAIIITAIKFYKVSCVEIGTIYHSSFRVKKEGRTLTEGDYDLGYVADRLWDNMLAEAVKYLDFEGTYSSFLEILVYMPFIIKEFLWRGNGIKEIIRFMYAREYGHIKSDVYKRIIKRNPIIELIKRIFNNIRNPKGYNIVEAEDRVMDNKEEEEEEDLIGIQNLPPATEINDDYFQFWWERPANL